jgi:hypothetical protein
MSQEGSQSHQTIKYGHESSGTGNQEFVLTRASRSWAVSQKVADLTEKWYLPDAQLNRLFKYWVSNHKSKDFWGDLTNANSTSWQARGLRRGKLMSVTITSIHVQYETISSVSIYTLNILENIEMFRYITLNRISCTFLLVQSDFRLV